VSLLISATWVVRIRGVSHQHLAHSFSNPVFILLITCKPMHSCICLDQRETLCWNAASYRQPSETGLFPTHLSCTGLLQQIFNTLEDCLLY
jgi:hypothetical protein